ncbi:MAG: PA0069 family radical SAM protein [Phycisphaerales bacterium]|nr:PA0069 family radical SAM protein [Phycisphaerales bacterium]
MDPPPFSRPHSGSSPGPSTPVSIARAATKCAFTPPHAATRAEVPPSNDDTEPAFTLPDGPVRGRGAGVNPVGRFEPIRLTVHAEHLNLCHGVHPDGRQALTQVYEDDSRTIINAIDVPDLPFRWTLNPYRGCEHGCAYCYARPTHAYFGLSSGLDFETRIFAKREAPRLLARALARPAWKGEAISMSGVTDPYQPVERELAITRGCLEVMAEARQAVSVITKSALIERDADLLGALARHGAARALISLTTLDNALASAMEPRASSPRARLGAVEALARSGIPVTVMIAPVIPGLNDREVPAILRAASEAGASGAGWVLLRLPHDVREVFVDWLRRRFPDRADHVLSLVRQCRGGELNDSRPGTRMKGEGPVAEHIRSTFRIFAHRCGLDRPPPPLNESAFRRPGGETGLFDSVCA